MFALERQKKIMDTLSRDGSVFVSKLSSELGVTEETIRRDLEKLEKQESLRRTHGGAVPIDGTTFELSLEKRKSTNVDAKKRLAKKASEYVVSGDTIFLDASTTTFFMAKEIKSKKNVTVITNSLRVLSELAGTDGIKVIAIGGVVGKNQSFVGYHAEKSIEENYFANKMFFSSKGVTHEAGILESNEEECGIKQKMITNSNKRYYLCDKTKIGRVGFVKLADFGTVDCFITDTELDQNLEIKLLESDIELIKI